MQYTKEVLHKSYVYNLLNAIVHILMWINAKVKKREYEQSNVAEKMRQAWCLWFFLKWKHNEYTHKNHKQVDDTKTVQSLFCSRNSIRK